MLRTWGNIPLWRNVNLSGITWSLIDYNSGRVWSAFSILLPQNKANKGTQSKARSMRGHLSSIDAVSPGLFLFPSLFLSSSLAFEDRRRKIEIVTYSRVPFVRMSTGRRHGAQLHRRPIVPQSRFVTVTYGDIPRREIAVVASNGRSTLLFPILFAGMSRAVLVCATCFRRGMARCCLIFHRWEPLAHAHATMH